MRRFEGETFSHTGYPLSLSHVNASDCAFNQCFVRSTRRGWNKFSSIDLDKVRHWNCEASGCVFDELTLRDLKKEGAAPLFLSGCAFRHVTLVGTISGLKINRSELATLVSEDDRIWRDEEIKAFYSTVDWALDISKAKFPNGATFEALPGNKIIRDRSTQALIRRERLSDTKWRSLDYQRTAIDVALSWFESGSLFDEVVLAPRSNSKARQADMAVLEMLRREGIAELD